jgi:hypothetical protein
MPSPLRSNEISFHPFGYWNLEVVWDLEFGAWDLTLRLNIHHCYWDFGIATRSFLRRSGREEDASIGRHPGL